MWDSASRATPNRGHSPARPSSLEPAGLGTVLRFAALTATLAAAVLGGSTRSFAQAEGGKERPQSEHSSGPPPAKTAPPEAKGPQVKDPERAESKSSGERAAESDRFKPSEEVAPENDVPFPVDI